jgi:hypothetical protein
MRTALLGDMSRADTFTWPDDICPLGHSKSEIFGFPSIASERILLGEKVCLTTNGGTGWIRDNSILTSTMIS